MSDGNRWRVLATLILITTLVGTVGCGGPQEPGGGEDVDLLAASSQAAEVITPEALEEPIRVLAADEYEGRGPGSAGDERTQAYLIEEVKALGLEPGAADGTYRQPFGIVGVNAQAPAVWTFSAGSRKLDLAWSADYIAFSGVQEESAAIEGAEVVFVGYGIEAPEHGWDDYKGTDLTGKVLLMLNNDPDWDEDLFAGERRLYYGRWTYKYEIAAAKGAVGAIIIHTDPSAGYPWQVVQTSWTGPQFEIPAGDEPRIQVGAWTTWEASQRLVSLAGRDLDDLVGAARGRDFTPQPLGVTTSLRLTNQVDRVETANILALLPGRDPELMEQVVVYSAHHDHLGVGQPDGQGDTIYNGALDNASGVAQVLAIAQALKALPAAPRRSVLFAFVAAEEQGLLGSRYYAENPTVPAGRIAANINYDGANIWGRTRDVTYIGYGKSSLDEVVERFAAAQGRTVKPDQAPDKGYFYRSDQFNFAKIGVPAIYLDTGTEFIGREEGWGREQVEAWVGVKYHQPSDELEEGWDFEGIVEDARLGLFCGLELAEASDLPRWLPGDEFEAARLRALATEKHGSAASR